MPATDRSVRSTRSALTLACIAGLALAAPALADREITLKNGAPGSVDALHVVFSQPTAINVGAGMAEANAGAGTVHTLAGALGADGEVSFSIADDGARVERWWWTREGVRVGPVGRDPGQMLTIESLVGTLSLRLALTLDGAEGRVMEFTTVPDAPQADAVQVQGGCAQMIEIVMGDCIKEALDPVAVDGDVFIVEDADAPMAQVLDVAAPEPDAGGCFTVQFIMVDCDEDAPAVQMLDGGAGVVEVVGRDITLTKTAEAPGAPASRTPPTTLVDDAFIIDLVGAFGTGDPFYDLNNDGAVDKADLAAAVASMWAQVAQPAMGRAD